MSRDDFSILYITACGEAGVAEYVCSLAEQLSTRSIRVTVVGPVGSRFAKSVTHLRNVRFIGLPICKEPHLILDLYCCYKLNRIMANQQFDIVHSNSSKGGALTAISKLGISHTKFVYSSHCPTASLSNVTQLARLYFAIERWAARRHDLLIATCRAECVQLLQTAMSRNRNCVCIHNGVEVTDAISRTEPAMSQMFPRIGTAARLVPQKGLDILIESLVYILEQFPNAQIEIAGEGPMEAKLRDIARENGIENRVRFLGYMDDCNSFIADLDLFVLPSRWEAFPFGVLRAGLVGTSIVASDVGGVSELIDESTGWLVKPNDARALAEAISEALSQRVQAAKRAVNLRELICRQYSLDNMVERTLNAYNQEISGQSAGLDC